jgi:Leucine-rich repeat (LRR) protein
MQHIVEVINNGNWEDIEWVWSDKNNHKKILSLLSTLKVSNSTEITIPEWLHNVSMILPLIGLLVSENPDSSNSLQEIKLSSYHSFFPKSFQYFKEIKLLQIDDADFIDLSGIDNCTIHTLVVSYKQFINNASTIARISGLQILIITKCVNSTLNINDILDLVPNIEELYAKVPLGDNLEFGEKLRYISFDKGYLYLQDVEGSFQQRLTQAKIENLPIGIYPNITKLEECNITLDSTFSYRYPKLQVIEDNNGRLQITDEFWKSNTIHKRLKLGKVQLQLNEDKGSIASRITHATGTTPTCYCPKLKYLYIPNSKIKLDTKFIKHFPNLHRLHCKSATYSKDFWISSIPIKVIEEIGIYPRRLFFSSFNGTLSDRLETIYCNYRWLLKQIEHIREVKSMCVYQCKNLAILVHKLGEIEHLYVESLPFGKESDFDVEPIQTEFPQSAITSPYNKSWRKRLPLGGFGFLQITKQDQVWEKWKFNQKVRFTHIEHLYNFSYCWNRGYRSARLANIITYDDNFQSKLAKHFTNSPMKHFAWLFDFQVTNGYFRWTIEIRHRNGRSSTVQEQDQFQLSRIEYLVYLFEIQHPAMENITYFINLDIEEDEVRRMYNRSFPRPELQRVSRNPNRSNDKITTNNLETIQQKQLLTFFPVNERNISIGPDFIDVIPDIIATRDCNSISVNIGQDDILPAEIFNSCTLKELNVSQCNITVVPKSIDKMVSIEKLLMWNNNIYDLPQSFAKLSSLKVLNLSQNPLSIVPESIQQLKNLERLFLSHTNITTLPDWLLSLPKLSQLDIKGLNISNAVLLNLLTSKGVDVRI